MTSNNYNTQNLGSNITTTNTQGVPLAVDQAGYLALQVGVADNLYPTAATSTVGSTLQGLIDVFGISNANTVQATVNAAGLTESIPINLIAASQGQASVFVGYNYNNNINIGTDLIWKGSDETVYSAQLGGNFVSVTQLQNVYNTYSAQLQAGDGNSNSFWQSNTALQQVYNYYNLLYQDANNLPLGSTNVNPPANLIDFLNSVQNATYWTPQAGITLNPVLLNGTPNIYPWSSLTTFHLEFGGFSPGAVAGQLDLYNNILSPDISSGLGTFTSEQQNAIVIPPSAQSIYSSLDQSFFSTLGTSSSKLTTIPTTPDQFLQEYFNYFTTPNPSTSSTYQLTGTALPVVLSNGGVNTYIGTTNVLSSTSPTAVAAIGSAYLPQTAATGAPNALETSIETAFTNDFQTAFDQAFVSSGASSNPVLAAEGETNLFNSTFAAYMNAVSTGAIKVTSIQDMVNQWSLFVGPSVTLGSSAIISYQQIYDTFFPGGTDSNFLNLLNAFISQFTQSSGGVFNSSLMADQWYATVQNSYLLANNLTVNTSQPLLQANFSEVKVIFELYSLLINVLGDIQKLTAAQAQYDNVLVKLESAYTTEIAGIPDDLIGSNIPGGVNISTGLTSTQLQVQSSYESQISNATQKWISNITSFNTEVSNQEKNQTTTISQSNEASNQQSNLINSILQELQSLLQSIWR